MLIYTNELFFYYFLLRVPPTSVVLKRTRQYDIICIYSRTPARKI